MYYLIPSKVKEEEDTMDPGYISSRCVARKRKFHEDVYVKYLRYYVKSLWVKTDKKRNVRPCVSSKDIVLSLYDAWLRE